MSAAQIQLEKQNFLDALNRGQISFEEYQQAMSVYKNQPAQPVATETGENPYSEANVQKDRFNVVATPEQYKVLAVDTTKLTTENEAAKQNLIEVFNQVQSTPVASSNEEALAKGYTTYITPTQKDQTIREIGEGYRVYEQNKQIIETNRQQQQELFGELTRNQQTNRQNIISNEARQQTSVVIAQQFGLPESIGQKYDLSGTKIPEDMVVTGYREVETQPYGNYFAPTAEGRKPPTQLQLILTPIKQPTQEPPKSLATQYEEFVNKGGLLGLLGWGKVPGTEMADPLNPKQVQRDFATGAVASGESLFYGVGGLITAVPTSIAEKKLTFGHGWEMVGIKTPALQPDVTSAIVGSGLESVMQLKLTGSEELQQLTQKSPAYIAGSFAGDIISMWGLGEAQGRAIGAGKTIAQDVVSSYDVQAVKGFTSAAARKAAPSLYYELQYGVKPAVTGAAQRVSTGATNVANKITTPINNRVVEPIKNLFTKDYVTEGKYSRADALKDAIANVKNDIAPTNPEARGLMYNVGVGKGNYVKVVDTTFDLFKERTSAGIRETGTSLRSATETVKGKIGETLPSPLSDIFKGTSDLASDTQVIKMGASNVGQKLSTGEGSLKFLEQAKPIKQVSARYEPPKTYTDPVTGKPYLASEGETAQRILDAIDARPRSATVAANRADLAKSVSGIKTSLGNISKKIEWDPTVAYDKMYNAAGKKISSGVTKVKEAAYNSETVYKIEEGLSGAKATLSDSTKGIKTGIEKPITKGTTAVKSSVGDMKDIFNLPYSKQELIDMRAKGTLAPKVKPTATTSEIAAPITNTVDAPINKLWRVRPQTITKETVSPYNALKAEARWGKGGASQIQQTIPKTTTKPITMESTPISGVKFTPLNMRQRNEVRNYDETETIYRSNLFTGTRPADIQTQRNVVEPISLQGLKAKTTIESSFGTTPIGISGFTPSKNFRQKPIQTPNTQPVIDFGIIETPNTKIDTTPEFYPINTQRFREVPAEITVPVNLRASATKNATSTKMWTPQGFEAGFGYPDKTGSRGGVARAKRRKEYPVLDASAILNKGN